METFAILAYGSLIDDPGPELAPLIESRRPVKTPFPVEYARSSTTRNGGPTLVPVAVGDPVAACLLFLRKGIGLTGVQDRLWRRETRRARGRYKPPANPGENIVLIDVIRGWEGADAVLYTRIAANICAPTPDRLAELAIQSAQDACVGRNENGIAYLRRAMSAGVVTRLTPAYEAAILAQTGTGSLEEALDAVCGGEGGRSGPPAVH